jgi:hypothetical protein
MRGVDDTGLRTRITAGRRAGAHRSTLTAALAVVVLSCLLLIATGAAAAPPAPPDFSIDALLAKLALQQAELTATDGGAGDAFGRAVALDGDTALIGAYLHSPGGKTNAGAAYVFTRSGASWTQQAKLVAADGVANDRFGHAVALSGDTALIGAPLTSSGGKLRAGAAYVFTRSGTVWTLRQKLTATDGAAEDTFGSSVAVSSQGTALIGAESHDVSGLADAGAAYVFTLLAARPVWIQQAELNATNGAAGDRFGTSVALAGETALVGAPTHGVAGELVNGAAYVFTRTAGAWAQQQMLTASDGAAQVSSFGHAVALAGDTALVGAPNHAGVGKDDDGAAYVFTRSAGAWTQQQMLAASDGAFSDEFGDDVALSGDTALIGVPSRDTGGLTSSGAAYVFRRVAGAWTQQPPLTAPDAVAQDSLGWAVAVSGETALVGAPHRAATTHPGGGAAFVFLLDPLPVLTSFAPATGLVGTSVGISGSGFTGATAVDFKDAAATFTVDSDTHITATVPSGATSGPITVTTPGGTAASAGSFTVIAPAPILTKLNPAAGKRGAVVSVVGKWFGTAKGAATVRFGNKTCSKYVVWGDSLIKCRVPTTAKVGTVKVVVTTAAGESNGRSFLVKP